MMKLEHKPKQALRIFNQYYQPVTLLFVICWSLIFKHVFQLFFSKNLIGLLLVYNTIKILAV